MGARLKKKITEAHKAVNSTRKQLALIKKVIKVVKHMNKTYHDDANNKFTDIKPVMDMLYNIVSNLKVETDLIKRNIVNITTKVGLKEVSADSRTHEESMQVLDFIIAYFQKLLGYE